MCRLGESTPLQAVFLMGCGKQLHENCLPPRVKPGSNFVIFLLCFSCLLKSRKIVT